MLFYLYKAYKTCKGLKTHIDNAHKSAPLNTPEKEQNISTLNRTVTTTKVCGREEEEGSVSPGEKNI